MVDARAFFADAEICQEWTLPTTHLGRHVVVFSRTDSTNSQALRLIDRPECSGLALVADEQNAGRGQHGRAWIAPPRASVLLSILFFPPDFLTRPVVLTALVAVAVCRLVHERTGHSPRIKWPNDVLVHNRKICGVLIEQARHSSATAVVFGIGLNVTQSASEFATLGLPQATSLRECGDPNPERDIVARQIITLLDEEYGHLLRSPASIPVPLAPVLGGEGLGVRGSSSRSPAPSPPTPLPLYSGGEGRPIPGAGLGSPLSNLEAAWRGYLALGDSEVVVEAPDALWTGRISEVSFDGLRLLRPGLDPLWLPPEAIRHIGRH